MRLPFFYGWLIVVVTFVTMAIGVTARTSFSLLFPPIIEEFGWERGITAGAFSFGFLVSGVLSPLIGRMMDRHGPRAVMELGVILMGGGMLLAPLTTEPWHLYLTIGVLVGGGSVCLGYSGQSLFLPNWFVRRRGIAISIAASGNYIAGTIWPPILQAMIASIGWRQAYMIVGVVCVVTMLPLVLTLRRRPAVHALDQMGAAATAAQGSLGISPNALTALLWIAGHSCPAHRHRGGHGNLSPRVPGMPYT